MSGGRGQGSVPLASRLWKPLAPSPNFRIQGESHARGIGAFGLLGGRGGLDPPGLSRLCHRDGLHLQRLPDPGRQVRYFVGFYVRRFFHQHSHPQLFRSLQKIYITATTQGQRQKRLRIKKLC